MCDNCGCGMKAQQMSTPAMFSTDSMNTLGSEVEEGSAHEMAEPKGPHGEDID